MLSGVGKGGFSFLSALPRRTSGSSSAWSWSWKVPVVLWMIAYAAFHRRMWEHLLTDNVVGTSGPLFLLHTSAQQPPFSHQPSTPTLPHRLVFTYKEDLLLQRNLYRNDPIGDLARNVNRTIALYTDAWNEEAQLRGSANAPPVEVEFLLDSDCLRVVNESEPRLAEAFSGEEWGPHKSDLCRIAALWNKGGYYFDNDLVAVQVPHFSPRVTFVTVYESSLVAFFQAFIAVTPHHPIIREALNVFVELYSGRQTFPHNFGTHVTRQAYIQYLEKQKRQRNKARAMKLRRNTATTSTTDTSTTDTSTMDSDPPSAVEYDDINHNDNDSVYFLHERCLLEFPKLFPNHPRHGSGCHPQNNVVFDLEHDELLFESRLTSAVAQRYKIGSHGRGF